MRRLDEYRIALRGMPNDAETWASIGYVQRRLGNWAAADSAYRRSVQLDPRNANTQEDLGATTLQVQRRYPEAVRALDRALALAPDLTMAAVDKGYLYVIWKGDLDTLRAVLDALPADAEVGANYGTATTWRARLMLWERKGDSLLALVNAMRGGRLAEPPPYFQPSLFAAWAHRLRGDERAAQAAFVSALKELAPEATTGRDDGLLVHSARGLAMAGLGRKADALREARWLKESSVYREDHMVKDWAAEERACILAQVGEVDEALDEIERILAAPGWFSAYTFRLDPRWDSIRQHPRFRALLVKYANPERPAR